MGSAAVQATPSFRSNFESELRRTGTRAPDGAVGIIETGLLSSAAIEAIAAGLPEGTWEFVCHPGYRDDDLRALSTRLRESREIELRLLCSASTRQALQRHNIEITSYREFLE